jgi:hypothetical protein
MEDIELCSVLAARLARVASVYVQLRIVHLSGCETNVDFTANCSTEGADRKSAVLGRFQRIPGISVSSTPS